MKKYIFVLIAVLSLLNSGKVLAQYGNQTQKNSNVIIDKKVVKLGTNDNYLTEPKSYLDNTADNVLREGDRVEFVIKVENVGNETVYNIKVTDKLPKYLRLILYPGTYNLTTNVAEWTIDYLNPGESKTYKVRAEISGVKYLGLMRQINEVKISNDSSRAVYYVAGNSIMPSTGSNTTVMAGLIALTFVGTSLVLRKATRGY